MRFSSSTSTVRPASLAIACARSAKTRGVSVLPGSLAELARQVRALAEHAAALERRVDRSRLSPPTRSSHAVEPHARRVVRLVRGAVEVGEHRAFGQHLRGLLGRHAGAGAMDDARCA